MRICKWFLSKHILIILSILLMMSSQSIAQSKWAPIMMGNITTFVPNTASVQVTKDYYAPNATVTVNVQGYISGNKDWVGIYRKGTSTARKNIIAWNWVSKNGIVALTRNKKTMPAGEYEVRLFFHNNYAMKASDSFVARRDSSDTNPDGTAKDPYKIQTASYKLSGGSEPICNKPGIIRKDYSDLITCSWLCGKYEESEPSLVVISFIKESDIWTYNDSSVSQVDWECK